jgi:hypothetical protein
MSVSLCSLGSATGSGGGGLANFRKYSTTRATNDCTHKTAGTYTVNPSTDLGLENGAQLYYFMVGGGDCGSNTQGINGDSGKIIYGFATITTASTNLSLTIGVGNATGAAGTESTISGGLTLTTANGTNIYGYKDGRYISGNTLGNWGLMGGYGASSGYYSNYQLYAGIKGGDYHSFGIGGGRNSADYAYNSSGDGCIIFMY